MVFTMVATSTQKNKSSEFISDFVDGGYDQSCIDNELDFWERCLTEPYLSAEACEEWACQQLVRLLEGCLARAKTSTLHCTRVLVPETLTRRVARDVLRLAAGEPCGLRGCVLDVRLELEEQRKQRRCAKLERLVCDASMVPTFELTLVFKQDGSSWMNLRDFLRIGTCFSRRTLKLGPGFRLVKKKLYSSAAGTVVEEC
ncbi:DNA damage-inducible transcript 4-like protein [Ictalurus punctatus]|uniref:DNA damage-inducible transcript 4-like protein n=2 Tax=Ictalurus TaxID=7997 RepID=E3TCM5_ICTFU|nr:DNA damage-inducible transcript 4-like protein [Ictalurus punctatus]XP_053484901.1 DNA damage-inducible transcript 4-like protein isoform X1 [Ictalurus furcatus]ADO28061.1 DNA-damage-inducible transcript 4-like protein [Ictalurus furcatus]